MVSYPDTYQFARKVNDTVLILVVVEDGLVLLLKILLLRVKRCLNPCCSGRWSRTHHFSEDWYKIPVLILVVVEDGLVPLNKSSNIVMTLGS